MPDRFDSFEDDWVDVPSRGSSSNGNYTYVTQNGRIPCNLARREVTMAPRENQAPGSRRYPKLFNDREKDFRQTGLQEYPVGVGFDFSRQTAPPNKSRMPNCPGPNRAIVSVNAGGMPSLRGVTYHYASRGHNGNDMEGARQEPTSRTDQARTAYYASAVERRPTMPLRGVTGRGPNYYQQSKKTYSQDPQSWK